MSIVKQSGVPGVYWENDRQCWRAFIERGGKRVYLGRKKILEDAIALRMSADQGLFPSDEEKRQRLLNKMARVRMRTVWRELPKDHDWKSFDQFIGIVGDRPQGKCLVALDPERPIGPDNFDWATAAFDFSTREGRNSYNRAHYAANTERYRDMELRRKFGISLAEYNAMMEEQNGVCSICSQPETAMRRSRILPLAVDHNHTTGSVRGLLCTACNIGIGSLAESKERLLNAIAYLEKWDVIETAPLPNNVVPLKG